jgi:hypothetical protein
MASSNNEALPQGCMHYLMQLPKILFWQSPHSSYYKNNNQVKLSGCCYRSIDFTAIDSGKVELGAQHIGF